MPAAASIAASRATSQRPMYLSQKKRTRPMRMAIATPLVLRGREEKVRQGQRECAAWAGLDARVDLVEVPIETAMAERRKAGEVVKAPGPDT